jgi:malate dehydrogenase (oxaloacetate-decarboxylating)(NADP+)
MERARVMMRRDLGVHGMGIPVGKSVVYGGCGMDPRTVLPVCVDVGCDTPAVRDDPLYLGTR